MQWSEVNNRIIQTTHWAFLVVLLLAFKVGEKWSRIECNFAAYLVNLHENWISSRLRVFQNIKSFGENLYCEGLSLLPVEVEIELYQISEITRNLLVITLLTFVMYYGWSRSARDETWAERRFASFFTLSILSWLFLATIIPFSAVSILHPDLILEIGQRVLSVSVPTTVLLFVVIIIVQALNFKGYFRKND